MSVVSTEEVLQGNLAEIPLAALLRMLASKHRTGLLWLEGEAGKADSEIWLQDGKTYLATSERGAELGAVLFGAEAGTNDEIEILLTGDIGPVSALDQILGRKPHLEPKLRRALHEYTLTGIFDLLVPSSARFRFEPERVHQLGSRFAVDTDNLVAKAEQRLEIWRRIAARIPSTSAVFMLAPRLPSGSHDRLIGSEEWRYIAKIDGRRSVGDIVTETGESAFRVCSTLYRLLIEGLIAEASPRS